MVLSPISLWANYDREKAPLCVSELRTKTLALGKETTLYFDGEASAHGCTRIYARLLCPTVPSERAVLMLLRPQTDIASVNFDPLLERGYAVLVVDYAGDYGEKERHTLYPPAFSFANYDPARLYEAGDDPYETGQFHWTAALLRALTYLQSLHYTRIAMLGVGIGGASVFRAAGISDVPVCGISLYSPGFYPDTAEVLPRSAALDVHGYAQMLKVPYLQLCCSNDEDGSLDDICDLTEQTGGRSLLYISPRSGKAVTAPLRENILLFFAQYLDDAPVFRQPLFRKFAKTTAEKMSIGAVNTSNETDDPASQTMPLVLTANGEDRKLYYTLQCEEKPQDAAVYVSHGITHAAYRNWRSLPIEKIGEAEYIGSTEVFSLEKPVFAFACATTESGFHFCTPVSKKIPSVFKMTTTTISKRRLVYDSDMGIDDFFALDGNDEPTMKSGPFDIEGICCPRAIGTYKIGDATFSGSPDGVLQLLMYSPVPQIVRFGVIEGETFRTYSCETPVSPASDWTKIMLPASLFKSAEGNFSGWENAIFLRIDCETEIIISSILWV